MKRWIGLDPLCTHFSRVSCFARVASFQVLHSYDVTEHVRQIIRSVVPLFRYLGCRAVVL